MNLGGGLLSLQSSPLTYSVPAKLEREPSGASRLLRLRGSSQRDGSFGGEQKKGERLLQIQPDGGVAVAKIADRDVLANVQVEIAATGSQHESAGNGGRPDDLIFNQPLHVLEHWVSVIAGLGERGVGVGAEQHGIGTVDTDQTQLA